MIELVQNNGEYFIEIGEEELKSLNGILLTSTHKRELEILKDELDREVSLDSEKLDLNGALKRSFTYQVLSNRADFESENRELLFDKNVFQWDRIFRLSPQTDQLLRELEVIDKLKPVFESEWVHLPGVNKPAEEVKPEDIHWLPENLLEELSSRTLKLPKMAFFAADFLWTFFHKYSYSVCLFFVEGRITSEQFLDIFYVFNSTTEKSKMEEHDLKHYLELLYRLEYLKKALL